MSLTLEQQLKALGLAIKDISALKNDVEALKKVKALVPKAPGPLDLDRIKKEVLDLIPKPKDGRDGRDWQPSALDRMRADVCDDVYSRMEQPADGVNGTDGMDGADGPTAEAVAELMPLAQDGDQGIQGPTGPQGRPGPLGQQGPRGRQGEQGADGASVQNVTLKNNQLMVTIDGKQKKAGTIDVRNTSGGSGAGSVKVKEAPKDGKQYGRQNCGWTEITGGGGGDVNTTFIFDTDTTTVGLLAQHIRYNNTDPSLVTELYISKSQVGGLVIESELLGLQTFDSIFILQRSDATKSQNYEVTALPTDNTGFVTVPVTRIDSGGANLPTDQETLHFQVDIRESVTRQINREASSKIISGGEMAVEVPGVPAGKSYSVAVGEVLIVNPDGTETIKEFGPFTGQLFQSVGETELVFVNSLGLLIVTDFPQPQDFRTEALLGVVARTADTEDLTAALKFPKTVYQVWAQLADVVTFLSGAADASARISNTGANTSFQRFAGNGLVFMAGVLTNFNNPHIIPMDAEDPSEFKTYLFNGIVEDTIYSGLGTDTVLNVTVYDDLSGDLVTVPGGANTSQIIRVFWQPNALGGAEIRLIQGQTLFSSLTAAFNGAVDYFPILPSTVSRGAIDLGAIVVRRGATDFSDNTHAIFIRANQVSGGAGGTVQPDFQDIYFNSVVKPQILTTLAAGSLDIQDGILDDIAAQFRVLDQVGDESIAVTGGGISRARGLETSITGILDMDGPVTINGDLISVDVPAGSGQVLDYYTDTLVGVTKTVKWVATNVPIPNPDTSPLAVVFIDNTGAFQTANAPLTNAEHRENIEVCSTLSNTNTSQVIDVFNTVRAVNNTSQAFYDYMEFIGGEADGGGVAQTQDPGTNGDLALAIGQINIFLPGLTWHANRADPNVGAFPATDPTTWTELLQDGTVVTAAETELSGVLYDDGTDIPAVVDTGGGGRRTTIQYLFKSIQGDVFIQLGQFVYTDMNTAVQALDFDKQGFVIFPILDSLATPLAAILITQNALTIADPAQVIIENFSAGSGSGSSGSTTFKGLADTPAVAGADGTVLTWNFTLETLENSTLQYTQGNQFVKFDLAASLSNHSIYIGSGNNTGDKASLRNVVLGNSAFPNASGTASIATLMGDNALPDYTTGTGMVVVGERGGVGIVTGSDSAILGVGANDLPATFESSTSLGALNFTGPDDTDNCHIWGVSIAGPSGSVTDYFNIHQTIQADIAAKAVTIGAANNTKPTATHRALALESNTQVLGLNSITQTQEDAIAGSILPRDIWHNSTTDKYRVKEGSVLTDLIAGLPPGSVQWVRGLVYLTGSTIRFLANAANPIICRSSDDTFDIVIASNQTVSRVNVGVINGLDTGVSTANTQYDFHAVADSSGVNPSGLVMTVRGGGGPTLPAGYDKSRLLIPLPVGPGNVFIPFTATHTGRGYTFIYNRNVTEARILTAGNATTPTTVSAEFALSGMPFAPSGYECTITLSIALAPAAANDFVQLYSDDANLSYGGNTSPWLIAHGDLGSMWVTTEIPLDRVNSPNFKYRVNDAAAAVDFRVCAIYLPLR